MNLLNIDCMEYMKTVPDKYFDLAIVDPPYGNNASKPTFISDKTGVTQKNGSVLSIKKPQYKHKEWDNCTPTTKYFSELNRISKHKIIWGVNFFKIHFGVGRIIWDKLNDYTDQYDCEIAYNSVNDRVDIVRYMWAGMMQGANVSKSAKQALVQQGNKALNENRIHPTQKPVKLYKWLLTNYAKEGDKIFDSHLGSMSIAIACHDLGFDLTGCEIDKEYYDSGIKRVNNHKMQTKLF